MSRLKIAFLVVGALIVVLWPHTPETPPIAREQPVQEPPVQERLPQRPGAGYPWRITTPDQRSITVYRVVVEHRDPGGQMRDCFVAQFGTSISMDCP